MPEEILWWKTMNNGGGEETLVCVKLKQFFEINWEIKKFDEDFQRYCFVYAQF